jgi:hypothetical protein
MHVYSHDCTPIVVCNLGELWAHQSDRTLSQMKCLSFFVWDVGANTAENELISLHVLLENNMVVTAKCNPGAGTLNKVAQGTLTSRPKSNQVAEDAMWINKFGYLVLWMSSVELGKIVTEPTDKLSGDVSMCIYQFNRNGATWLPIHEFSMKRGLPTLIRKHSVENRDDDALSAILSWVPSSLTGSLGNSNKNRYLGSYICCTCYSPDGRYLTLWTLLFLV